VRRHGQKIILHFFVNTVGNGFDVGIGIAFTDDKKICRSVAEFPQIQLNDIFAFLVADALDDQMVERFELRIAGGCPPGCCYIQSNVLVAD
jgi:hypothetical protein